MNKTDKMPVFKIAAKQLLSERPLEVVKLTDWERDFLESIVEQNSASDRQVDTIKRIIVRLAWDSIRKGF